ncbi:MAG TPA: hypothetical protein VND80_11330 [Steroidobacteraceae bacterium]|nr:hypothetical protein [Steroidobacteraceae bacterium]
MRPLYRLRLLGGALALLAAAAGAQRAAEAQTTVRAKPAAAPSSARAAAHTAHAATSARPKAPLRTAPGRRTGKSDFIALGTTTVTGNKELPKVMYIVPWRKSGLGDLGGEPVNSLLDQVLAPVDRDVFRRQVAYYQALASAPPQKAVPSPAAAPQGEK